MKKNFKNSLTLIQLLFYNFRRTPSPSCTSQHQVRLGGGGVTPTPTHRTPRSTIPRTPAHSMLNDSEAKVS